MSLPFTSTVDVFSRARSLSLPSFGNIAEYTSLIRNWIITWLWARAVQGPRSKDTPSSTFSRAHISKEGL